MDSLAATVIQHNIIGIGTLIYRQLRGFERSKQLCLPLVIDSLATVSEILKDVPK